VSKLLAWDDSKPADGGDSSAVPEVQLRLNLNGKGVLPPERKP
jgi:hypothetical protein